MELSLACENGNLMLVNNLLERKAKVEEMDKEGNTPLIKAVKCKIKTDIS